METIIQTPELDRLCFTVLAIEASAQKRYIAIRNEKAIEEGGAYIYFCSSEKVFYRKMLEIYALSIGYDPRVEMTTISNVCIYKIKTPIVRKDYGSRFFILT